MAVVKLRGLAAFAAEYVPSFHRIEAVAKLEDDTLRVLDLQDSKVPDAVESAADVKSLCMGNVATDY